MTVEEVLSTLGEIAALEAVRPFWEESERLLPSGRPSFLTPEEFLISRDRAGFGPDADAALCATAERIVADPGLLRLAWHAYRRVYVCPDSPTRDWPGLERALGEQSGIFWLLIALSMIPLVRQHHRVLNVPEEITRETCLQISCMSGNYARAHGGRLGIFARQVGWLKHYTREAYFRLGRLEYWLGPHTGHVQVYRHTTTGRVVALAGEGMLLDEEGYALPAGMDRSAVVTATIERTPEAVVGYPVLPTGKAQRRQIRLPMNLWRRVLAKDDHVLRMHIPAGGGLTPADFADSLKRAVAFFGKHFPDRPVAAITCRSWTFSPILERILPPESNLVRCQRQVYLHPFEGFGTASLWFIFLQEPFDPASAPRQTALQRAILSWLEGGNSWRDGGMFILTEDVSRIGSEYYRQAWERQRKAGEDA